MKKLAYILLLSLPFFGIACQGDAGSDTGSGYGAENPQYSDDNQSGTGRVDETGMGRDVSNDGNTRNETTSTGDTMHTPGEQGADQAARASEKTQTKVGNSYTRGEKNESQTNPENARTSRSKATQPIPRDDGAGK